MNATIQARATAFGAERMQRYDNALKRQPTARYLEILPLLCLCARPEVRNWDVVDIGSGTGFLADFFEGVARSVTRVDKSFAFMDPGRRLNAVASDMHDVSKTLGGDRADVIVSVGAFHHNHEPEIPSRDRTFPIAAGRPDSPERYLDAAATLRRHRETLADWHRLLKPGGMMILADVPGRADPVWKRFQHPDGSDRVDTLGYYRAMLDRVSDWEVPFDIDVLAGFFRGTRRRFWERDSQLAALRHAGGRRHTMRSLLESYRTPEDAMRRQGPMVTTDFFDEVVHTHSLTGHYGFYPHESWMRHALDEIGMEGVYAETLSTPWLFPDRRSATWFVHELFSLGEEWERDSLLWPGQEAVERWLDDYLGFYRDDYGRLMLSWQLEYVVAIKPNI